MTRDQVIALLREHEAELKAAGVVRLSLFARLRVAIAARTRILI